LAVCYLRRFSRCSCCQRFLRGWRSGRRAELLWRGSLCSCPRVVLVPNRLPQPCSGYLCDNRGIREKVATTSPSLRSHFFCNAQLSHIRSPPHSGHLCGSRNSRPSRPASFRASPCALAVSLAPAMASAQFSGLFNTAVDNSNVKIAEGQITQGSTSGATACRP
jgi:hypothetical protein